MAASSSCSSVLLALNIPVLLVYILSSVISSSLPLKTSIPNRSTSTNPVGFTSHLIHCDSPDSPFYNPNLTQSDRIRSAVRRSLSRHHRNFQKNTANPNDMRSSVSFQEFEYVMKHYIGTPPIETYTIVDTASGLIWLQCLPCETCFKQKLPIFDPSKSSSYTKIGCEDKQCKSLPAVRCDEDDSCQYGIVYMGFASSEGTLSSETFVFDHDDRAGNISILALKFGCGHKNTDPFGGSEGDNSPPGVMGLNRDAESLISQLSYDHFSHCFVFKNSSQNSLIRFGVDAVITEGSTSPILDQGSPSYYYLSLDGISIGKDRLAIPAGSFKMTPKGKGGVFIDSGTTYTTINEEAHNVLVAGMEKWINLTKGVDPLKGFELCYKGKLEDIQTAPDVTFHFTGVDLVLGKLNTWIDAGEGNVCLAMLKGELPELPSILGNHQLQNVNVGFDLKRKLISFKNMDCNNA